MLAIEVGGSSTQAVCLDSPTNATVVALDNHRDKPWLLAAPGLVEGDRVRGAHHLGWMDVHASAELGMASQPRLGVNDAEAAAIGEWVLRSQPDEALFYISMGTGVGATVVDNGTIVPVEYGHLTAFGPNRCGGCGRVGCLDAQIGGHALPTPLNASDIDRVVEVMHAALAKQTSAFDKVVVGGGLPRRYPEIVATIRDRIDRPVEPSAAPSNLKSAAPFGLQHIWRHGSLNNES